MPGKSAQAAPWRARNFVGPLGTRAHWNRPLPAGRLCAMDGSTPLMKFLFSPLLPVLALAFVLAACEKSSPPPDKEVLFKVLEDNVHALEKKDVDAVMATIHPQA